MKDKIENRKQKKETSVILNVMKYLGFRDVWLCRLNINSTYAQHDKFLLFVSILFITSCTTLKSIEQQDEIIPIPVRTISSESVNSYTGWWVYGEGQHIFKDEQTLEEYEMEFPNENMEELVELYLAVCEMEYFPMECKMTGTLSGNILMVQSFEILYIQGCGE
ncbi:MAG: hypothetical protein H8E84_05570 [Flavobacteriales bacterium]|nr:hypothetical protein [Flavobacteriales bacterium]